MPEQTQLAVPAYVQILGFPLEAAAVLLLPYFGVKYLIDKDDVKDDIGNAVVSHLWGGAPPPPPPPPPPGFISTATDTLSPVCSHVYAWTTELPLAEPVWTELLTW